MNTTRLALLACGLLLTGCAGSDPAPEPERELRIRLEDPAAETARLKEAEAAGDLEPNALKHAAYLGDAPAGAAIDQPAPSELKELCLKIGALGGPSPFRTALAGLIYAAPEADWTEVRPALVAWIATPADPAQRTKTAEAVVALRERLDAEIPRATEEEGEGGFPTLVLPEFTEEQGREILRITELMQALHHLERCAKTEDGTQLANAFAKSLRLPLNKAFEDVERDRPGPEVTPEIQEDLATALAAHNRGPQLEATRAYLKAAREHRKSLGPHAQSRLIEVLREALVPELLGR